MTILVAKILTGMATVEMGNIMIIIIYHDILSVTKTEIEEKFLVS